jgi:23S rRNA pseudouridine1911/1915/1917 synthase
VGIVHRLDRNVSGAMVVAKSSKAASRLSAAFRDRDGVEKTYLAWVAGGPRDDRGTLRSTLVRDDARRVTEVVDADDEDEGREAWLDWEVDARGGDVSRLRVRLRTGATHQIRAQLAAIGCPLVGDRKYGGPASVGRAALERPALHARRLAVPHPVGGAPFVVEAPVPKDLVAFDRSTGTSSPDRPGW